MNFPQVHVAGDTLDFQVSVPDYPSTDGWTLTYYLTPRFTTPTQAPISVAASANADGTYQVQRSPAQTAAWAAGAYGWARIVSKTGARQTLTGSEDQGEVLVRADPSTATQGADTRSHAKKVLESIEAVIEGRATKDQEEYQIGSRMLKRTPIPELLRLRSFYRNEAAAEDAGAALDAGSGLGRKIQVRL